VSVMGTILETVGAVSGIIAVSDWIAHRPEKYPHRAHAKKLVIDYFDCHYPNALTRAMDFPVLTDGSNDVDIKCRMDAHMFLLERGWVTQVSFAHTDGVAGHIHMPVSDKFKLLFERLAEANSKLGKECTKEKRNWLWQIVPFDMGVWRQKKTKLTKSLVKL